jgi:hypothetical protein
MQNSSTISSSQANLTLLNNSNQNLTSGHKLLLNWHNRFGNPNFLAVRRIVHQFPLVSACDLTDLRLTSGIGKQFYEHSEAQLQKSQM